MNEFRLVVASIGGAAILSCAHFAFAMTTQTRIDHAAAIDRASVVYEDARDDTRDAKYKAAPATCDAMSDTERDACVASARSAHGK